MVNTGKRLFFVTVLTFALLVTMSLPAFTQTASAASRPMDKKLTVFYYKTGDKEANRIWLNPEFKFTKSKSSKKKVAVIKHDKMQGYYLQIKKPGKTKLTLYAKKWNGKKWSKKAKKYKTKLTVITYTNGFSDIPPYAWGYVDNLGSDFIDGPAGKMNYFRLATARDVDGAPANLGYIDFIKIQTAQIGSTPNLGDISTEVYYISDYHMEK